MPHVWPPPGLTMLNVTVPDTATGAVRLEREPSPSWPNVLLPQQNALPSATSPHVCSRPAAMDVNGLGSGSTVGPDACRASACARIPVPVSGDLSFRSLATGWDHTCGLTDTGAAYCWAYNVGGELGDGPEAPDTGSATTLRVATAVPFVALSAGDRHTCALSEAGKAYCWGENRWAQLGPNAPDICSLADSTTFHCSKAPVAVADSLTFVQIAAGGQHTCGRTSDGAIYCWGYNEYGQLGVEPDSTQCDLGFGPSPCAPSAVLVSGGLAFATITAGGAHNCGLLASGAAYCWGDHLIGQLGDCSFRPFSALPRPVCEGHLFAELSAGSKHTCAVATDESAYCWGDNDAGALGSATFTSLGPVQVSAPLWE